LTAGEKLTKERAVSALQRAVRFFRQEVAVNGGYLWRYSHDLAKRQGELEASKTTAWVQPPGTPSVGEAFLEAYGVTGDAYFLDAAQETAAALISGQLRSGGWDYRIEFDPKDRRRYAYRSDNHGANGRNVTTLDDDTTQAALRYLMRVDQALAFKDAAIHEAVQYALDSLLKTQYPNGAWPQRYSEFPDPGMHPVKQASYPETWSRTHPKTDYRSYYTFNDHTIDDVIDTMFLAAEIYGDDRYRIAAESAGDFILLAQMPEPQPAWAQQYNSQMHPAWARRFEPPSVTGGESQQVLRTLLMLYRKTGKKKYLAPIPRALDYLEESKLPDGRLARFYELKTNRPLYFTKKYELTDSPDDLPTHYGFLTGSKLSEIRAAYSELLANGRSPQSKGRTRRHRPSAKLAARAKSVVESMDERGAWIETGRLKVDGVWGSPTQVIQCRTFADNVSVLCRFLTAGE
jgi:PelA/Pel-15E family pectate lyase